MITDLDAAEEQNKRLTEEAYRLNALNSKLHAENKRLNDLLNLRNPFNSDVDEQQIDAKAALQDQVARNDKLVATLNKASKALSEYDQRLKAKDEELRSVKAKFMEIQGAPGSKRFQDDLTAELRLKHDRITTLSSELESTQRLLSESEGKVHKLKQDLVGLFCKVKMAMLPIPDSENAAINYLQEQLDGKDKMLDEIKNDNRQIIEISEGLKMKLQQEGHDRNILNTKMQSLEKELARLRVMQPTAPSSAPSMAPSMAPSNFQGHYNGNGCYQQQRMPTNMPQNQQMYPPPMQYQQMPPMMMNSPPPPAPAPDMSLALQLKNMQMQLSQLMQKQMQNGFDQKQ